MRRFAIKATPPHAHKRLIIFTCTTIYTYIQYIHYIYSLTVCLRSVRSAKPKLTNRKLINIDVDTKQSSVSVCVCVTNHKHMCLLQLQLRVSCLHSTPAGRDND